MQQQEESQPPMSAKYLAIIGVILAIIVIAIIIISSTSAGKPSVDSLDGKVETTSAAAIKSHVDLNYVIEGEYAYSYENLIQEAKEEDKVLLEQYRDNLMDFEYLVRGDGRAYQIKYTNIAGDAIVIDGNYSEEYR